LKEEALAGRQFTDEEKSTGVTRADMGKGNADTGIRDAREASNWGRGRRTYKSLFKVTPWSFPG